MGKLRKQGLEGLEMLSEKNKTISKAMELQNNGDPPAAPIFHLGDVDSLPESERRSSLLLCWHPPNNTPFPSFYVLEFSGMEGSQTHRNHEYSEIYRDPPTALGKNAMQKGEFWLKNLEYGTKYHFRLRAFNGYGPSPYTYASFSTAPLPPQKPSILEVTPTTATLSWSGYVSKRINPNIRGLEELFNSNQERNLHR